MRNIPLARQGISYADIPMAFLLFIANVAIATSAVGYGATFLGAELTPWMTCLATIAVLWIATLTNFGGPNVTGKLSSITV